MDVHGPPEVDKYLGAKIFPITILWNIFFKSSVLMSCFTNKLNNRFEFYFLYMIYITDTKGVLFATTLRLVFPFNFGE